MAFASSSSSLLDSSKCNFDVFVSFRGQDTRNSFTAILVEFLRLKGIDVFSDPKLPRGESLSGLFEKIKQSKMSIIVFSENFANSSWCLEELWIIMQCKRDFGHEVIPIFYRVRKSDVENQEGSFKPPYKIRTESSNGDEPNKLQELKLAMKTVSNIAGFVYDENRLETEFVKEIVKATLKMLNKLSPCEYLDLPGIELRSEQLEELLMFDDAKCIRTIGVLGMAGIGKTTVADTVYKRSFRREFDGYGFLEDVGDVSERKQLNNLRRELLCQLFDEEKLDVRKHGMENFLQNKKVFIVVDNVTSTAQIEVLVGQKALYRKGSRIVITSRDKKLLQSITDATYVVPRLNDKEAMELFCLNAFPEKLCPTEEFMDLSNNFVDYSKGHPSALTLLGSCLLMQEKSYWLYKLECLRVMPDNEIQNVLKRSYDELSEQQKTIFLDISCFFRSERANFLSIILKSDRIINPAAVMQELEDKCLVTISYDRLEMHDLLHMMGKEIGYESSIKKKGHRSRLWNHDDIRTILEKDKGTKNARGIFLNMSDVKRINLRHDAFETMPDLKFLKFHNSHCSQWCETEGKIQFHTGLTHFPDGLVYLHWQGYPYKYLPSEFNPEKLIDLSLRYSNIKQLWKEEKVPHDTEKLRWVDLSYSHGLGNLSGLSKAKSVEKLDLEGCTSLVRLDSSIKHMNKLMYLNLRDCTSLESLPEGINLESLRTLILSGCSNLQEFHIISESIEYLYLEGSAIEQVAEQVQSLRNLILLNLKNCRRLRYLPNDLYKLKSLQELILSGCSALESLPPIKEKMECLEILLMDETPIKQTPEMICLSNLKIFSLCGSRVKDFKGLESAGIYFLSDLYLTNCNIEKLPDHFSSLFSLRCLCLSRNNIETLPESIEKLRCLLSLDLKYCRRLNSLPVLPSNLEYLDAHECVSLEKVARPDTRSLVTERMQTNLIFTNCFKLNRAEQEDIVAEARFKSQLLARTSLQYNHKGLVLDPMVSVCFPGSDIPSWFRHQRMGSSIKTDLLPHWCNKKFIGASLCVVVSFNDHEGRHTSRLSLRCKSKFVNGNGQPISFSFCHGGWNDSCGSSCHEPRKLESDHVFISYNNFSAPVFEWREDSNEGNGCHASSASFEFEITDETERKLDCCKVVRCGMSLLYAQDENDRGFQGRRVANIVERTSSEAPIRGQFHSQFEERRNGRTRDEFSLCVSSKT